MGRKIELPPPKRPEGYGPGELAALLGLHPNSLRRYEDWGFIGPVPRRPNGYRYYTPRRAREAALVVLAQRGRFHDWPGSRRLKALILATASGDYARARGELAAYGALLEESAARLVRADASLARLGRGGGRGGAGEAAAGAPLGRWRAAEHAGVAPDTLRDWERNGLVDPPRLPNGRRAYRSPELDRVLFVKLLRDAGHSYMGIRRILHGAAREEDLRFARDRWERSLAGLLEDLPRIEGLLDELEGRGPRRPD